MSNEGSYHVAEVIWCGSGSSICH